MSRRAKQMAQAAWTRGRRAHFKKAPKMPRHQRVCGCCDGWGRVQSKYLCVGCRKLVTPYFCPVCREAPVKLPYHVRVPRRKASDRVWRLFVERFVRPSPTEQP